MLERFTSRKFLTALIAIITEIAALGTKSVDAPTALAFIMVTALGYIATEGVVDARRAATITRTAATVAQTAAAVLDEAAKTIDTAATP